MQDRSGLDDGLERRAGLANDQLSRKNDSPRALGPDTAHTLMQEIYRMLRKILDRLALRRQPWRERTGPGKIVDGGYGDIARTGKTEVGNGVHRPDHHLVVGNEKCARAIAGTQELPAKLMGPIPAEIRVDDMRRIDV